MELTITHGTQSALKPTCHLALGNLGSRPGRLGKQDAVRAAGTALRGVRSWTLRDKLQLWASHDGALCAALAGFNRTRAC